MKLQDIVLCKIYRKATSLKVLEQRAAMEEEIKSMHLYASPSSPMSSMDTMSFCNNTEQEQTIVAPMPLNQMVFKREEEQEILVVEEAEKKSPKRVVSSSINLPSGKDMLFDLQVPRLSMDWTQDPFWNQLNSPWLQNLTPYANILNF